VCSFASIAGFKFSARIALLVSGPIDAN